LTLLKRDLFGSVTLHRHATGATVIRATDDASPLLRPVARWLARREARALRRLAGVAGVATVLAFDGRQVVRSYVDGEPMQRARPRDPTYFRLAFRLLRQVHRRGVAHADLAKEPNWLVTPGGEPALVDWQLAHCDARRGRLFRWLAREDLRHLLKHKRTYCAEQLTSRERQILATPGLLSRAWRWTGKPLYRFVTRGLLGWADREGAGDRR